MGNRFWITLISVVYWTLAAVPARAASGQGALGVFLPSDQDDPVVTTRIWRAYSAVDPSLWNGNQLVSTRLGVSNDNGKSFSDVGLVNLGVDLGANGYSWSQEASTLVYDPADPYAAAAWKILWQRTFLNSAVGGDHRDYSASWIGMRTAATPASAWSAESKLIAGAAYQPGNPYAPGPSSFALPGPISDCAALTEPAALTAVDGFYLALHCRTAGLLSTDRIVLLRLRHQGGQTSLESKGTLLNMSDATHVASAYGSLLPELSTTNRFAAPSLVAANGKVYLLATPIDSQGRFMGCLAFEVSDLETAALVRNPDGGPHAFQYAGGQAGSFRGSCTASPHGTQSGIALSQRVNASVPYTIVQTLLQLP